MRIVLGHIKGWPLTFRLFDLVPTIDDTDIRKVDPLGDGSRVRGSPERAVKVILGQDIDMRGHMRWEETGFLIDN